MARKVGGVFFLRSGVAPRIFPIFFCSAIVPLIAQQKLSPGMNYHRVMAVTPLVGSGTAADPKPLMFVPAPQPALAVPGAYNSDSSASTLVNQFGLSGYFAVPPLLTPGWGNKVPGL